MSSPQYHIPRFLLWCAIVAAGTIVLAIIVNNGR